MKNYDEPDPVTEEPEFDEELASLIWELFPFTVSRHPDAAPAPFVTGWGPADLYAFGRWGN
jgi:hypothetical protein